MVERSVYIVEVDTDRYGRTVGQLHHSTEGYDINAPMVCAGHAWWYGRYAPDSELLEGCQDEAQGAPKGLWADAAFVQSEIESKLRIVDLQGLTARFAVCLVPKAGLEPARF
jgi:endonuclease YncB( thermonuclease family)